MTNHTINDMRVARDYLVNAKYHVGGGFADASCIPTMALLDRKAQSVKWEIKRKEARLGSVTCRERDNA